MYTLPLVFIIILINFSFQQTAEEKFLMPI